jgi:hypothetical protein
MRKKTDFIGKNVIMTMKEVIKTVGAQEIIHDIETVREVDRDVEIDVEAGLNEERIEKIVEGCLRPTLLTRKEERIEEGKTLGILHSQGELVRNS